MLLRLGSGRLSGRVPALQPPAGGGFLGLQEGSDQPGRPPELEGPPGDGLLSAAGGARRAGPVGGTPKRAADIAIAAAALLVVAPLLVVIAIMIRATSRGPAIFAHQRIGFGGRSFACYKFRTMVADSEAVLAEYLASDAAAARQWQECQKLPRDPRVTAVGRILRKSSLDELPQLFNILRGEMSCVGPRPIVREELARYGALAADYLRARPGLTGLWQVTGRSSIDYDQRVTLDVQYIRTWSIWTDVVILFRTTFAVMRFNEAC